MIQIYISQFNYLCSKQSKNQKRLNPNRIIIMKIYLKKKKNCQNKMKIKMIMLKIKMKIRKRM